MRITIPAHVMQHAVATLARQPNRPLFGRIARACKGEEVLIGDLAATPESEGLELRLAQTDLPPPSPQAALRLLISTDGRWNAELLRASPAWAPSGPSESMQLFLPGRWMHRIGPDGANVRAQSDWSESPALKAILGRDVESADGAFSRTAGALDGWDVLRRLQGLHVGVVGLGRNGSAIVEHLARFSVAGITLIDGDVLEPSNLDAMSLVDARDVDPLRRDVSKAAAIAARVADLSPATRLHVVTERVQRLKAVFALARCDLLISAPDHDAARFITAALASAYLRPHLDVGSAVQRATESSNYLGADIRLTIPGQRRCLACFGGLASMGDLEVLARSNAETDRNWTDQKAGSLRSLSAMAAGLGIRLMEDLTRGVVLSSTWWRMTQKGDGSAPTIVAGDAPVDPGCPVCAMQGDGDAAVAKLSSALRTVLRWHAHRHRTLAGRDSAPGQ